MPLSLTSFIWSSPSGPLLTLSNPGHSQNMCTDVSFSGPHFLHDGDFTLPTLCSMYLRLARPVRSPSISVPTRTDFSKNTDFWTFVQIFFLRDHFYRFYLLILLFCKLCECDAICCELCDDKCQKNLVSILSIVSIHFSCFFFFM